MPKRKLIAQQIIAGIRAATAAGTCRKTRTITRRSGTLRRRRWQRYCTNSKPRDW